MRENVYVCMHNEQVWGLGDHYFAPLLYYTSLKAARWNQFTLWTERKFLLIYFTLTERILETISSINILMNPQILSQALAVKIKTLR